MVKERIHTKLKPKKSRAALGTAGLLALGLLGSNSAQAGISTFPEAPCEETMFVAHFTQPGSPGTPPTNITFENLYSSSLMSAISATNQTAIGTTLWERMNDTYVISTSQSHFTTNNINDLTYMGFGRMEAICPIAGLSDGDMRPAPRAEQAPSALLSSTPTPTPTLPLDVPWHSVETGSYQSSEWILEEVDQNDAYPDDDFLGSYPIIAVLDTGIDPSVVSLAGGWSHFPTASGMPAQYAVDKSGHGTMVAELIDEAAGGFADIYSIKVLNAHGRGNHLGLARGMLNAIRFDADVVNLSLGHPKDLSRPEGVMPEYVMDAFLAASRTEIRTLAAAGNTCHAGEVCSAFYPAAAPDFYLGSPVIIFSVGGLMASGNNSAYSVNSLVDLSAPSEHICGTASSELSPVTRRRLSGSSFSTAQVSGSYALLLAYQSHRDATAITGFHRKTAMQALRTTGDTTALGPVCGSRQQMDVCASLAHITATDSVTFPGCDTYDQRRGPRDQSCNTGAGFTSYSVSGDYEAMSGSDHYQLNSVSYGATPTPGSATPTPGSATPTPIAITPEEYDDVISAAWCNGYSSSPSRELSGYGEYELEDIENGARKVDGIILNSSTTTYEKFTLTADLASWWNEYDNYQVKLRQNGNWTYIPLDFSGVTATPGTGFSLVYSGDFDPAYSGEPDAVYLIAKEKSSYFSLPLSWLASPMVIKTN